MSAAPHTPSSPGTLLETHEKSESLPDKGYVVICWNDPVNLMSYVTMVFQRVFGWGRAKAERHMLEVHEKGRSVLVQESREKAELHVHQLQSFQLTATLERIE